MKYIPNISYTDVDMGIEYLKKNKFNYFLPKDEKTIYHVYWYGKIDRKQICCINSYLKTQDLNNTELWVWLDYETFDISNDNIPNHKNIKIKKYIPNNEANDSPFENKKFLNYKNNLKFRSDIARLLFLYNYGGLYYDLDMILLKDLKPLLNLEFCYRWSNLDYGNNGILRIRKQSNLSIQLIKKYINTLKIKNFNINFNKLIFSKEIDIMCFPCVMFDPAWILTDTKIKSKYSKLCNFDNFFKKTNEDINTFFYNQIFAYHWHSRANYIIEKNSYFEKLENNN
jgi:hypothetical protein